jgi:PKD repeat protein
MIPVDMSGIVDPAIAFDLAHAGDGSTGETLRIEVFPGCDFSLPPVVVWEQSDPELITAGIVTNSFSPDAAGDWRREVADLSQFAGQTIIIRFTSVNGTGNNIYLDNIGIVEYALSQPVAAFVTSSDSLCPGDTVIFSALPSGGDFTNYDWYFGQLAVPADAYGPGPHTVTYITAGDKNVRMVAYNGAGSDTMTNIVKVLIAPSPNYSVQLNGLTATFTNTSQNALSYLWDFGDGNGSTAANPVHTYAVAGNYAVKLLATNQCKTSVKTLNVPITVGVEDLASRFGIRMLPNPTTGDFRVEMECQADEGEVRLSLLDVQGRLVKEVETFVKQGFNSVSFENLNLPKGVYQLNVQAGNGWQGFTVVVQ